MNQDIFLKLTSQSVDEVKSDLIFYENEEIKQLLDLTTLFRNSCLFELKSKSSAFDSTFLSDTLNKYNQLIEVFSERYTKEYKNIQVYTQVVFQGPAFFIPLN